MVSEQAAMWWWCKSIIGHNSNSWRLSWELSWSLAIGYSSNLFFIVLLKVKIKALLGHRRKKSSQSSF